MSSVPLLGSYKLSLFAGRLPPQTTSHPFLLVLSYPTPTLPARTLTVRIPFEASYHDLQSPWVATVDLSRSNPSSVYSNQAVQLPPKGQLTLIIQNECNTPLRLLLFPYNLRKLPSNSTVLLRRFWYVGHRLKYAVHLQFASFPSYQSRTDHPGDDTIFDIDAPVEESKPKRNRNLIFLFREIRFIFASSSPEQDEELRVESEGEDNIFPWTHWPTRLPQQSNGNSRPKRTGRSSSLCAMSLPEPDILHSNPATP